MKHKVLALLLSVSMVFGNTTVSLAASTTDISISEDTKTPYEESDVIDISGDDESDAATWAGSWDEFDIEENETPDIDEDSEDASNQASSGASVPMRLNAYKPFKPDKPIDNPDLSELPSFSSDATKAEYYVTERLPKLRDQGSYGSCWAHSALALAEINLMLKGYHSEPNLSELQLAYFMYNYDENVDDPLEGTKYDLNLMTDQQLLPNELDGKFLNRGGNTYLAKNVLASWIGAADEAAFPYSEAQNVLKNGLKSEDAFEDAAHLENALAFTFTSEPESIALAKYLIVNYGAIGISYASSKEYVNTAGETIECYNEEHNAFYRPDFDYVDHAVTIVGWDDNFSKENFNVTPPGDGAWLVRNSWFSEGVDPEEDKKHVNDYWGYFWMSYYEGTLDDYSLAFDFASGDNYDHNYQYDAGMYEQYFHAKKAANVFEIHGGEKAQKLEAVSFYTGNTNVNYKVSVYELENGVSEDDPDGPEAGTLLDTEEGTLYFEGYYTIPLKESILLDEGTVFSVVVELSFSEPRYDAVTGEEILPLHAFEDAYKVPSSWLYTDVSIEEGQSFVYDDGEWLDWLYYDYGNIRIKAFTSDTETTLHNYKINYVAQEGKVSETAVKEYTEGEEFTFEEAISQKKGYVFDGWYGDKALTVRKNGIEKTDKREITVYAKFVPAKYTIAFDAGGGTGSMEAIETSYDKEVELPKALFTKENAYFVEWNTKADGTGTTYAGGAYAKNLTDKEETVTLYALWSEEKIPVTQVAFDIQEKNLFINSETDTFFDASQHLVFTGKDGKEPSVKDIVWKSSNTDLVTVDENGYVSISENIYNKPAASYSATITATAKDDNKKKATVKVLVSYKMTALRILDSGKNPKWYASSDKQEVGYPHGYDDENPLEKGELTLEVGKSFNLKADFLPKLRIGSAVSGNSSKYIEAVDDRTVGWSCNNPAILNVNNGKITAVSPGTATVVLTAKDTENGTVSASMKVKVIEPAKSVFLSETSYKLGVGNSVELWAGVLPDAADQTIVWSVQKGKESIIEVDEKGLVTAKSTGTAQVIASTEDGKKSAKCVITVGNAYKGITIKSSNNKTELAAGKTIQLSVDYLDKDGSTVKKPANKEIIWSIPGTSPRTCAALTSKGLLTGLSEGKVTVRAQSSIDETVFLEKEFTVYVPVAKAYLGEKEVTLSSGKTYEPSVYILSSGKEAGPEPTGKNIGESVYSTVRYYLKDIKDADYVTVDEETGIVTAKDKETIKPVIVVCIYTPYGADKASELTFKVNVKNNTQVSKIKLDSTTLNMSEYAVRTLTATLNPTVPAENGINWTIADEDKEYIAFYDGDFVYTATGKSVKIVAQKETPKGKKVKVTATTVGTSASGKNLSAVCNITIGKGAAEMEITNPISSLPVGKTYNLKTKVYADDDKTILAGNQKVKYSTTTSKFISVDSSGRIKAMKSGTAFISVVAEDNPYVSDIMVFNVVDTASKIVLDKTNITINLDYAGKKDDYETVTPYFYPADAALLTWTVDAPEKELISWQTFSANSSDEKAFVIPTKKGITNFNGSYLAIKALKPGTVKLTGTDPGGKKVTCKITINTYVNKLEFKEESGVKKTFDGNYSLVLDRKKSLKVKPMVSFCRAPYSDGKATAEEKEATKLYNNAKKYVKNSGVTYYSKDPSIATVNANGKITAKGKGTTEIVAVTKEKSLKKTIVVTVR